jgi:murein DD-endopeptidase MepM/ murein hydrolase activator NlpD
VARRIPIPVLIVLLAASSFASGTSAGAECSRDWICVEQEIAAGEQILSARNLKDWPATLTLQIVDDARQVEPSRERTLTVAGGGHTTVARIKLAGDRPARYRWDWTPGSLRVEHAGDYAYRLPYANGASFRILQGFGSRFSHTGLERYAVDFDMPIGTPVHASRDGIVVMLEESHDRGCWARDCADAANYVVILHDDGTTGEYYHLQKDGVLVSQGERVHRGQKIALSGNTGHTTMPHLHFAVYRAASWGRTQSLPFRFVSGGGPIDEPRPGMRLVAVD